MFTAEAGEIMVLNQMTGQVVHRGAMSKDDITVARGATVRWSRRQRLRRSTAVCAETTVIGRKPATGTVA